MLYLDTRRLRTGPNITVTRTRTRWKCCRNNKLPSIPAVTSVHFTRAKCRSLLVEIWILWMISRIQQRSILVCLGLYFQCISNTRTAWIHKWVCSHICQRCVLATLCFFSWAQAAGLCQPAPNIPILSAFSTQHSHVSDIKQYSILPLWHGLCLSL